MPRISLTIVAAILSLANPLLCASAAQGFHGALTISVFDDAHLNPRTLESAERRAAFVLNSAGLQVMWISCEPHPSRYVPSQSLSECASFRYPTHVSVRISTKGGSLSGDVFGQCVMDADGVGIYSTVFYSRIHSFSQSYLSDGELLGHVIAHELGHLLLGIESHSATGIMQARWGPEELQRAAKGQLLFTTENEARLWARLSSRKQFFLFSHEIKTQEIQAVKCEK